jgi:hypothetical protein
MCHHIIIELYLDMKDNQIGRPRKKYERGEKLIKEFNWEPESNTPFARQRWKNGS